MFNKIKTIKILIFSVVIFTLLINLVGLGYVEYCRKYYTTYNNKVASDFHKYWKDEIGYYQKACLNLKPSLFLPTYNVLGFWSWLMIWISIMTMIVVKIDGKIFRRKIFSKKEKYILLSVILVSFIISLHIWLIELDYHYFGWSCSRFLL